MPEKKKLKMPVWKSKYGNGEFSRENAIAGHKLVMKSLKTRITKPKKQHYIYVVRNCDEVLISKRKFGNYATAISISETQSYHKLTYLQFQIIYNIKLKEGEQKKIPLGKAVDV